MAQFYTLDEAAQRVGIASDEFKRRLKLEWTSIRPFRDGATLRFRAADIDELARSLGAASDPGLAPGPVGSPPIHESDEFSLPKTPARKAAGHAPLGLADDQDLTFPSGDSGILGSMPKAKSGSDSDVRLDVISKRPKSDPESALPTEEISLDISGGSGVLKSPSSSRLSAPKSGTNLSGPGSSKIPGATSSTGTGPDSSSEFELSLDADSDSFELSLNTDSSDEVDLGSFDMNPQAKGPQSGINLGKPSDSGVSLEKKGPKTGPVPKSNMVPSAQPEDSDVDFELSLDAGAPSGVRLAGPKSGKLPATEDSSSEFELTLDDNSGVVESLADDLADEGKGDIFETDFELPVVADESGSEVVSVDAAETDLESTGFEVDLNDMDAPAEDDSASQVILVDSDSEPIIEDDDAMTGADLEEGASASGALRGVRREYRDDDSGPARTIIATPPKWGPLPAIVLFFTLVPVFIGMMMTFEILSSMKGYNQGTKPAGLFSRGLADTFGMKITD